jgi:maltoporin
MNKRSLVLVGLVAATLPMMAQEQIRSSESSSWVPAPVAGDNLFDGYFRTGAGVASAGGEMVSFDLGRNGHYRLGNEADTYGELGWDKKVFDKDGAAFYVHTMLNWWSPFTKGNSTATAPSVALEQAWIEGKGVLGNTDAFKDSDVWIGERFYNRQDVHMLDWKYLHTDGTGGGVENINLGFGKLAYAYMQTDTAAAGLPAGAPDTASVAGDRDVLALHQLKLDDINVNPGGKLYFAFEVDTASPYKGPTTTTAPYYNAISSSNNNKGGWSIIGMHSQDVLGGANHFVVQYAVGAAEGLGNGDQFGRTLSSLGSGNKALRVIDEIAIQPTKNIGAELVAAIEKNKLDNGAGTTADGSWATIGGRGKFGITDHFSFVAEVGWEKTTLDTNAYTTALAATTLGASLGDRTLIKETAALVWSPTTEFWSRPELRIFFTNASWNNTAKGTIGGVDSNTNGTFADKTSGSQYGVQTEVWF